MSKFLILGDIHFGESADHPDLHTKRGVKKPLLSSPKPLIQGIVEAAKLHLPIEAILVPGDLTSTAQPAEFLDCLVALKNIADGLRVPHNRLIVTFGNHDVNWTISRLAEEADDRPADTDYKVIAAMVGPTLLRMDAPNTPGPLAGSGVFRDKGFEVVALNSGHRCTHDQTVRNGSLGTEQMAWFANIAAKPDEIWRILMVHHHPINLPYPVAQADHSTLEEGADFVDAINNLRIDVVVHGHRHHPMIHTDMRHGWEKPITYLCAGSVGAGCTNRTNGDVPNTFHILHLNERDRATTAACGMITTYSYRASTGWRPPEYSMEVPINAVQHFGACIGEASGTVILKKLLAPLLVGSESARMPAYSDLPYELKCMRHAQLNDISRNIMEELGYTMGGSYPGLVTAHR